MRYKFYLSSVQERREEAVSQLRAARPRGHQLKALIGQQYIKVFPGSGSSERQESISWAFVSKQRNTEEERKKKKTHLDAAGCGACAGPRGSRSLFTGSLLLFSFAPGSAHETTFPASAFRAHITYIPQKCLLERLRLPGPAPRARVDAAHSVS